MQSVWTTHIKDAKDKENFQNSVIGAKRVLDRLKSIIESQSDTIERSKLSLKSFDSPNWAEKRAFKDGMQSAYQVVKEIIDLDQQQLPTEKE